MNDQLTDSQIANWRTILCGILGPYALIMSREDIQAYRDRIQASVLPKNDKRKP